MEAKEFDGYIIAKNGENIFGHFRITSVNYPNGAVTINNINYLPLYISVFFKQNGTTRFVEYFADDIDGFSFTYDGQDIFFFSIELPHQSWGKAKYPKSFLRLLVNGDLILFDSKRQVLYGNYYNEIIEYYISDRSKRVLNLADNKYTSFEEYLLKELKIEKEFLLNQTCKINIKNMKQIISNYNCWTRKRNELHD